ncbi:MAG: hypothetical protein M1818_004104 [Claussenomyces sp. TS43310]|nr:MAG: hypothetical protein M1818_004104 [Claussenomyces sp. TS43310]
MAPSSSDPQNLVIVLNLARRRALGSLVTSIIAHMRSNVEQSFEAAQPSAPLFVAKDEEGDESYSTADGRQSAYKQRRYEEKMTQNLSTPKLLRQKRAALKYFDGWHRRVMSKLSGLLNAAEDLRAAQKRQEIRAAAMQAQLSSTGASTTDTNIEKEVAELQEIYHPIPTRLSTIEKLDLRILISSMLLLLLSLENYSAHSRVLLIHLTSSLSLPLSVLTTEETEIARTLLQASKQLSADPELQRRKEENRNSRRWKVGLASVAGAALIGVTGGIAAPLVAGAVGGLMGVVGLGGAASFLGVFAMNGALMGSLFGVLGGKMSGAMMDNYAKEVEDFKFLSVKEEGGADLRGNDDVEDRRLRVTIGINGWLNTKEDVIKPWRILGGDSEVFALRYEMDALLQLGASLKDMVSSYAWSYAKVEILKRTVLASIWTALWPIWLLKVASNIDNPFAVARNRSEKAGEVLADALINRAQGQRPVTLVGYSLGARVIYSCLNSLAERQAFGLIETVVFIGAPVPSNANSWRFMRSVVSGRLINVFSGNDYILAFLYRATSIQLGVAGLQKIENVEGVEDLDLSAEVSGHLRYPDLIGKILKKARFADIRVEDSTIQKEDSVIQLFDSEDRANMKEVDMTYIEHDIAQLQAIDEEEKGKKEAEAPRRLSAGFIEGDMSMLQLMDGDEVGSSQKDVGDSRGSNASYKHHRQASNSDDEDHGIQLVDNDDDAALARSRP